MIPLRLEISNFLSYRDTTTLDFHGLHLACISGPNGAGKSSILDAITWSLFGRSRSKSDDDVVNRQAYRAGDAAVVDFIFELEGVVYRAIRSKKSGRSATLEFQMALPEGGWKSLSEAGIRQTQAAIEVLLNMNFDVFINASFLLQGKADEFTTKTANKRKEILADLLAVNEWDRYKDAAAERRKEAQNRQLLLDNRLAEIVEELAERPMREAALAAASQALELVNEQLYLHEQILLERRRTEAAIVQQKKNVEALAKSKADAQRSLSELDKLLTKRHLERERLQTLLNQSESVEAAYQNWQTVSAEATLWQQKADAYGEIQQKSRPYELRLEREQTRLEQRKIALERQSASITTITERRTTLLLSLEETSNLLKQLSAELSEAKKNEAAWIEAKEELQRIQSARALQTQEQSQLAGQRETIMSRLAEKEGILERQKAAEESLATTVEKLALMNAHGERLKESSVELAALQSEQPLLREKMEQLDDRIRRLNVESGGHCPVCGQAMSDEHRLRVLGELQLEGKQYGDRWRQNRVQIEELSSEKGELEKEFAGRESLEKQRDTQQQLLATVSAKIAEINKVVESWSEESERRLLELNKALADDTEMSAQMATVSALAVAAEDSSRLRSERDELQARITATETNVAQIDEMISQWNSGKAEDGAGSFAELERISGLLATNQISIEDQQALAELRQAAVKVGYDPLQHQTTKDRLKKLSGADSRYQELQQAQAAMKPLAESVSDLEGQMNEQRAKLEEVRRHHEEAVEALDSLSAGAGNLAELEEKVQGYREQQIEANRREETAQQRLNVLDDLSIQRDALTDDRNEQSQLIRRLLLLEKACGREGVQALLIERALPEIEDDANELLERLSGGQMQITFDTQRKLKSSDRLAETLDIRIVDGAGERPYENYSGGEQFRVNFAIRLALSKILTRRAGARLQTLVIDEGFGSQDPTGRQRLIEAINIVQDDFERVLVITHIDELRDAFPNRIEVEKGPGGSQISVI